MGGCGDDEASPLRVVVAIATFCRPAGIVRVLPPVMTQCCGLSGIDAEVVVIDNDPAASARSSVSAMMAAEETGARLRYVHEPRPGIASARNRAVSEAGGADLLVFIDDDEIPRAGWLAALVLCWSQWRCAIVTGPVYPIFEAPPEEWVEASGVFDTAVKETGSLSQGAHTNNILYDMQALRRHNVSFDEEFGLSGGSDTMLAHLLRSKGEQIRWCAEAMVDDYVPAGRATRPWVTSRTVRTSNTWARVRLRLAGGNAQARAAQQAELAARGLVRMVRGTGGRALARITGDVRADARAAMDVASGRGLLIGTFGGVRYEYRRQS